jgi:peroxiredoxin
MNLFWLLAAALNWIVLGGTCWLGWQLLRQNGRILLRLDELETRLDDLEFGEPNDKSRSSSAENGDRATTQLSGLNAQSENQSLVIPAATNDEDHRGTRFNSRSLARSRIKRDGLKAGTSAPSFRLPRLDGGELSLEQLRGKRVLLVFSDPHCGPCDALMPQLEGFYREHPEIPVVMIGRGEARENRDKVRKHGLTFPVVMQRQWEVSRLYAMFATPLAYVIDEAGVVAHDVAVGVEPILALMSKASASIRQRGRECATA